ncbi:substrate-binding periplasmic protein [Sulfurimonas sp.]
MRNFIIIFLLLSQLLKAEHTVLTVNSGFPIPETFLVESIVTEGFKRAGIPMKYQTLPAERSLINVNMHIDDVEAGRINGVEKFYPNMIRVPVQIHSIDIVLLSRENLHIKEISDLKKYNVGLNRGVKIAESIAKKANAKTIVSATSYDMLIKMLKNNRIDVIITSKIALLTMLSEIKEKGFFMTSKPLVTLPLYTHVNNNHKDIVLKLENAYKSMELDGTIQKLQNEFLHGLEEKIGTTVEIISD